MANKTKRYDLNAADRRRNRLIQAGLTAIVIIFAAALVFWIMNHKKPVAAGPAGGENRAISVAVQDKLIKDSAGKPKVVLSMYEDFLCPHCGEFEQKMGSTVQQLIDTGAVQADYYMVALPPLDTAAVPALFVARRQRRLLRRRRRHIAGQGRLPALPCRALRAAAR